MQKKAWFVLFVVVVVSIFGGSSVSHSQEAKQAAAGEQAKEEQVAQAAADAWLKLVDSENYDKSWEEAATYFKGAVTKEQWVSSMNAVRKPLGKLVTRAAKEKSYHTSLPGAPDGQYVVIHYETSFENKKAAIETVTPMKEKDGKWRVSGYFIK